MTYFYEKSGVAADWSIIASKTHSRKRALELMTNYLKPTKTLPVRFCPILSDTYIQK